MQFDNFADFLAMGGYGFFVWLSFGSGAVLLIGLIFHSIARQNVIKNKIAKRYIRQQKFKKELEHESTS